MLTRMDDDTTAQPARPGRGPRPVPPLRTHATRGRLDGGPTDLAPPVHDYSRRADGLTEWSNLTEPGGLPPVAAYGPGVRLGRWRSPES